MKRHIGKLGRGMRHPTLQKIYSWLFSHKKLLFAALLAFFAFMLFADQLKAFIVIALFALASIMITTYKRVIRMPPVLELISITSVMVTLFYGPIIAVIYTLLVNLASEVMSGYPDVMSLTYLPSRTVQVIFVWIAGSLTGMGVVAIGIWSVILFNAVQQPIFMFLTDAEQRLKALYFVILNIPINVILFRAFAEPLHALLAALL